MINDNRLELHKKLVEILGSNNVYFQPPSTIKMNYPAIVYSRDDIDSTHADNIVYKQFVRYQIILIDKSPTSKYIDAILQLPMCSYERGYQADNLNHDAFIIYV